MKRNLGLERTYVLGQYRNIKLYDSITDIPEELAFSPRVISGLRTLQIVQTDKAFLKYVHESVTMNEDFLGNPKKIEEYLEELEKARVATIEDLKEAFAELEEDTENEKEISSEE